MHDIDRTVREFETALQEIQPEQLELAGEDGGAGEIGLEALAGEFQEGEGEETLGGEIYEGEMPLTESEETELASELLEVTTEEELDQFLGRVFRRIGRGIRRIGGRLVRPLGRVLRVMARRALPIVGGAFGGPMGAALASAGGRMFGLELEGLSAEDQEYEVARRFVRFAASAGRRLAAMPPTADPATAVRSAVIGAARQFAPGLLRGRALPGPMPAGARRRGTWVRRGRRIILLGV
jgi:hypothetical protein